MAGAIENKAISAFLKVEVEVEAELGKNVNTHDQLVTNKLRLKLCQAQV